MSSDEEPMDQEPGSGSEPEESPQPKTAKGGKKRKNAKAPEPELPPFEYNDCIEKITTIASNVKDGIKARDKLAWKRVFPSLKKQAEDTGLPEQVLEDLWQIFAVPKLSAITSPQRRELLFLLIPDKLIPSSYVENMIQWLIHEVNEESNKTLHIPVLKYIFGLLEYGLIEGSRLSKPFWYTNLLYLRSNEDLIQWLFLILKKVTKKETIQRFYVTTLLDLWKRAYKTQNKRAIVDLLKLYKILRPDLLPDNVFNIRIVNPGSSSTKLPETFTKCLFEAKRRIIGGAAQNEDERMDAEEDDSINPSMERVNQFDRRNLTNSNFFPAMAPTCKEEISLKTALTSPSLTKSDKMLWALQDSARLPSLLVDGEMIEIFFSWLAINFNHYFEDYDPKQHHRYEFVLQKCIEVSVLLDEGLAPVDNWLCEFLISWDMDLFRSHVLALTSFFNLTEFSERIVIILQKFEHDFLYASMNRSQEIWRMFDKLLLRWIKQAKNSQLNESTSDDNRSAEDSVEKLFEFLNGLVTKFIALKFSTEICEPMILRMCETYQELSKMYNLQSLSFEPIPPLALVDTVILMDSLPTLNALLGVVNIMKDWKPNSTEPKNRLKQIKVKVSRYFGMGDVPSLMDLFERETAADTSLDGPDQLSSILKAWSFESSKAHELIQKNPGQNSKPELDMYKVRKIAPNLAVYLKNDSKVQKTS